MIPLAIVLIACALRLLAAGYGSGGADLSGTLRETAT